MASIEVRKGRDGGPMYRARIRIFGHPEVSASFNRKTDARDWANQIESDLRRGRQAPLAESMRRTVAELIEKYLDETLPHKQHNKTASNVRAYLGWWRERIGGYSLANVTPALVTEYRNRLHKSSARYGRTRGAASVNRYLAALSTAFTTAVKEYGWAERNPLANVAKLKEPAGRVRFLSETERGYLLDACKVNADLHAVVLLALCTGARLGEVLGIRWRDVDLDRESVTIHDTKNGDRRSLPLFGAVLVAMAERSKVRRIDDDRVFAHAKRKDKRLDVSASWYNALAAARRAYVEDCGRAGREPEPGFLENFRFHDLRHTCASYLLASGVTLGEIARILGHRTLSMTLRYSHLDDASIRQAVGRMNAQIFK